MAWIIVALLSFWFAVAPGCTLTAGGHPVLGNPTPTPTGTNYADAFVPPGGWQVPYSPNPLAVPACAADPCSTPSGFFDANSASEVTAMMQGYGFHLGRIEEEEPGYSLAATADTFPVFYASSSDPAYTVTCSQYGGCGSFFTTTINIPNGASASADSDHDLSIVNLSQGVEYDFWEFNDNGTGYGTTTLVSGGGTISVAYGGKCSLTSLASSINACFGSDSASAIPPQIGLLDPREELAQSIQHVIMVASPCGQNAYVYPAAKSDGHCSSGPQYGQRIWLDLTDAQIETLSQHRWAKTLLHQMHHYGFMLADFSGEAPWIYDGFNNATVTLWGQVPPWTAFFAEVTFEGDGGNLNYSNGTSHLSIPTTGILQSNIHILSACANTQTC